MALQYVGGNTATKAGATTGNSTISLTTLTGGIASSAAAGDIVIAVFATGSAADRTLSITDGTTAYTLINAELYSNGTTYDSNLRVAYKVLTAADASVTFGPTGNNADAGAMAVHVWRGVDTGTPMDVAAVPATGTGTGRPDAASITPTTTGAVILVAGGAAAGTGAVFVASALSNFRTATSSDTNDAMVGIGSFAWVSGAYDPAAWTGGTTNAADAWTAMTIALRPSVDQTLTPDLYTNTQTFYTPTVAATYALTPALYTNDQTFYAPTVTTSNTLTPDLYTNTQTFYSPDVTQSGGTQTLTPDLYTNTQTFYSATVTPGAVVLEPQDYVDTGYADPGYFGPNTFSTQVFYSPIVGPPGLLPSLYVNPNTFYDPSVFNQYPDPSQVLAGVQYGPGGIYVGTLTVGAGETIIRLRSFTERC